MAITCLNDLITLRGTCSDTTPVTGMYINDLAGVDLEGLSQLATDEQKSYKGVWDEVYMRSVNEIEADILVKMQKYFKSNILLENVLTGVLSQNLETESASANYKGVALDLNGTKNTQAFINYVSFYATTAHSGSIYIYDYFTGVLLDTLSYTASANQWNNITVNKTYNAYGERRRLFICYNATSISTYKTDVDSYWEDVPYYTIVRGAKVSTSSSVVEANMTFEDNTYGLNISFNLICAIEQFICSKKIFFKMPLAYKLGEHIMLERLTTKRFNDFTTIGMEEVEKLRMYYQGKYNEQIEVVLNGIEPENDDICFPCDKKRMYKFMLP